jgi:hypothetical protein
MDNIADDKYEVFKGDLKELINSILFAGDKALLIYSGTESQFEKRLKNILKK